MANERKVGIKDIILTFRMLADRVLLWKKPGIERFVGQELKSIVHDTQRMIPGLNPPPDRTAAAMFLAAGKKELIEGRDRQAFSSALRGLACAPHDPQLWYLASSACVELGSIELSIILLRHAVWICPGYDEAKRDLAAMERCFDDPPEAGRDSA